jgi:hypothetical protein
LQAFPVFIVGVSYLGVLQTQDFGGKIGGVLGSGLAYRYRGHRDTGRHLGYRKEGIEPLQIAAGQGDADNGQAGPAGQNPGQVGRSTCGGNYDFYTAATRVQGELFCLFTS